jgi:hypothetical protein
VLSERKFMRRYLVQSSSSICSRFRVVFHDTLVQERHKTPLHEPLLYGAPLVLPGN